MDSFKTIDNSLKQQSDSLSGGLKAFDSSGEALMEIKLRQHVDSVVNANPSLKELNQKLKNLPENATVEWSVSAPSLKDSSGLNNLKIIGGQIQNFVDESALLLKKKRSSDKRFCNLYFIEQRKSNELYSLLQEYQFQLSKCKIEPQVKILADNILQPLLSPKDFVSWTNLRFKDSLPDNALKILYRLNLDISRIYLHVKSGK